MLDQFEPFVVDQVALGQHYQAMLDLQQVQDMQVLLGLRHDAFVGSDDQHRRVDTTDARQHILDEALVAGNIDDADRCAGWQG